MEGAKSEGRNGATRQKATLPTKVLRFQRSERMVHWAIALPFMACYATALILVVFYNPWPDRSYREVFSWAHRLSGLCLILFPAWTLWQGKEDYGLHFRNIKEAWVWTYNDLKWLSLMGLAALNRKVSLPEQGKFNAAGKPNVMVVMTTCPLFILTGLLIWLPGVAFVSWLVHFSMAVMVTPLMLGHIFMATVNPSTRIGLEGMISGFVDRQWAKHHYQAWYRENFEKEDPSEPAPRVEPSVLLHPARVRCSLCREVHSYASWEQLLIKIFSPDPLSCPRCNATINIVSAFTEPSMAATILRHLEQFGSSQPLEGPPSPAA